jgi:hypothetical protein
MYVYSTSIWVVLVCGISISLKGHWHEIFACGFFASKLVPQIPYSYSEAISNMNLNMPRYSNSKLIPRCRPPCSKFRGASRSTAIRIRVISVVLLFWRLQYFPLKSIKKLCMENHKDNAHDSIFSRSAETSVFFLLLTLRIIQILILKKI